MTTSIETHNMFLRAFSLEDASNLFEATNDPEGILPANIPPFDSIETAGVFIQNHNQHKKQDIEYWAICDNSHRFLGFCNLKYHSKQGHTEIGYSLLKKYRKKAFVDEALSACLYYGFNNLKIKAIYAYAHPGNLAAIKILEHCGFEYLFNTNYKNDIAKFYRKLHPQLKIKIVSTEETIAVRHPVLRQGRPREDCYFPGDDFHSTIHFGLYSMDSLIGVATYLEQNHPDFEGNHLQLRGMAILDDYKGKGYGRILIETGEQLAFYKDKQYIWCNARIFAEAFYRKAGYKAYGKSFVIPKVGTHFAMYKKLLNQTK